MGNSLTHEQIVKRFVDSKAVDFGAIGRLVTEIGPDMVLNNAGEHFVTFGRYNILACFKNIIPQAENLAVVETDIAREVTGIAGR